MPIETSYCPSTKGIPIRSSKALILLVLVGLVATGAFAAEGILSEVKIWPGQEIKIIDPKFGELGYCLVYIPEDYSPDQKWPVLLYYHGLGGKPQTELLKQALNSRSFIIVAIGYYQRGMDGYQYMTTKDVGIIHRVLNSIEKLVSINHNRLILAGFSKGGFYTSGLLNAFPEMWAGGIILGAGARTEAQKPKALVGKPIFIGCGSNDRFLETAQEACKYYRNLDCNVTFEQWPDVGHRVGNLNGIAHWLLKHARGKDQDATPRNHDAIHDPVISQESVSNHNFAYVGIAAGGVALAGVGLWYLRRHLGASN